jgi:hypothetical protein
MPRAADAYATADKWKGWILAADGHGKDWARVFHVGTEDAEQIWPAITRPFSRRLCRSYATGSGLGTRVAAAFVVEKEHR